MKKLIIIILLSILIIILINPLETMRAVDTSFNICIKNLFPTLFPFLLISNIMVNYGFIDICSQTGKKIMPKLFGINANGFYVVFMSMLSGSPSNAKYINQLLDKNLINNYEANQLLKFTQFVNPLFIIGTIGITYLHSPKLGMIILISHYLGNFIIGLTLKKKTNIANQNYITIDNNKSFFQILTQSINDTINTLMLILGVITSCLILITMINQILFLNPLCNGILEITQGIKYISSSHIDIFLKTIIITFFISFGGLSIHMQVMSILEDKKIRYLPYLFTRIIHGLISSIIVIILYIIL